MSPHFHLISSCWNAPALNSMLYVPLALCSTLPIDGLKYLYSDDSPKGISHPHLSDEFLFVDSAAILKLLFECLKFTFKYSSPVFPISVKGTVIHLAANDLLHLEIILNLVLSLHTHAIQCSSDSTFKIEPKSCHFSSPLLLPVLVCCFRIATFALP